MTTIELSSTSHIHSNNHQVSADKKYHDLWKRTDKTFKDKELCSETAHAVTTYLLYCYNTMIRNGEKAEAKEFLTKYAEALSSLHGIHDENMLRRIDETLARWVHNIQKIYEDNMASDDPELQKEASDLYLKGQLQMFQAIFRIFAHSPMKDLVISGHKEAIAENLLAKAV